MAQATVELPIDGPINVNGTECTPSRIVLSPMGVVVSFPIPGVRSDVRGMPVIAGEDVIALPVTIIMDDGTTIEVKDLGGYASRTEYEGMAERYARPTNLIDVARVTQVTIGDTTIDVP